MRRVGALCGSLSKQTHTQGKEEGVQEPSPHYENIDLATMSQGFAPGNSEAELDKIKETRHPWSLVMERQLLNMFMIPCFLCRYGYRQILSNTDRESDREKH